MREPHPRHVVVVGGGITGLVAARRLARAGCQITLLEGADRVGGQVKTVEFAGVPVDVGAEALHLAAPDARRLVDELGLRERIVGSVPGTTLVWVAGRLRPLPAGLGPAGPTRLRPVVTSRVMTVRGLGRAGLEPLAARVQPALGDDADTSVGAFLSTRFGHELTDRLIDPLLGGLHAGDIDRLSLRACAPSLVDSASQRRSLILRRRRAVASGRPETPMFASFSEGLSVLTHTLVADSGGTEVRTGRRVLSLTRQDNRYRLHLSTGEELEADAVLLALPAGAAAPVLADAAPTAAQQLTRVETASVATVVLSLDRQETRDLRAFQGTGLLVPSSAGLLLKAMTHLSRKWQHLDDGRTTLVRVSAGRFGDSTVAELDDESLVTRLLADLGELTGFTGTPAAVHVERWPDAMPQLTVGHRARAQLVRDDLAHVLPGVAVAGASYDGVGLAACISSAEVAAAALLTHLTQLDETRSLT